MTEQINHGSKVPRGNSFWYIFLAAAAGSAGTAMVGLLTSATTLGWIGSIVQRPDFPKGAVVFVATSDCGLVGDGWREYELAAGRYLLAADASHLSGQTRDGTTKFKLAASNLPPIDVSIPYRLSRTSASNGGSPLMRALGPTGADEGSEYSLRLTFENREVDVTPPTIALLACQYVR